MLNLMCTCIGLSVWHNTKVDSERCRWCQGKDQKHRANQSTGLRAAKWEWKTKLLKEPLFCTFFSDSWRQGQTGCMISRFRQAPLRQQQSRPAMVKMQKKQRLKKVLPTRSMNLVPIMENSKVYVACDTEISLAATGRNGLLMTSLNSANSGRLFTSKAPKLWIYFAEGSDNADIIYLVDTNDVTITWSPG